MDISAERPYTAGTQWNLGKSKRFFISFISDDNKIQGNTYMKYLELFD